MPAFAGRAFDRPIELGAYPGKRVFIAEQGGLVRLLGLDGGGETTLLDLRDAVSGGGEEGLLSVALAPDFVSSGALYAYYTVAGEDRSRLSRFVVSADRAGRTTELTILEVEQPFSNHNGGAIRFGPDAMLYLSLGDGGSGGDPFGNGQDLSTLLGSIIRIDVSQASEAAPYRVPSTNPFLGVAGARGEIFAYGLRNPWRMSFDALTGQLWVADVGQDAVEEIDVVVAGGNYGWNRLEGERCFASERCSSAGTVLPVATYLHVNGNCSVSGGVVYRGASLPAITDAYLFADYCSGRLWAMDADRLDAPRVILETRRQVTSFGVDGQGDVYLLTPDGPILRLTQ